MCTIVSPATTTNHHNLILPQTVCKNSKPAAKQRTNAPPPSSSTTISSTSTTSSSSNESHRLPSINSNSSHSAKSTQHTALVVERRTATSPVENKLAEQDKSPMNVTYTIAKANNSDGMLLELAPNYRSTPFTRRSASNDSVMCNHQEQQKLSSLTAALSMSSAACDLINQSKRLMGHAGVMGRSWSNKLPQIDNSTGTNQSITCRQLWSKSQLDVYKYRRTLRSDSNNSKSI